MKVCLNPLCSSELPVNKKSPGQKYCNKKCWLEHLEHIRTECSKKCENPACNNIIKYKRGTERKFCCKSCSATVSNTIAPRRKKPTYDEIQNLFVSLYFRIDIKDINEFHIDKFIDDIIHMRLLYKISNKRIRDLFCFPYTFDLWIKEFYTRKCIPTKYTSKTSNISKKPKKEIKSKTNVKKEKFPSTKIYRCKCQVISCDTTFYYHFNKKFCKKHENNYAMSGRNKYDFKFNIFDFPDLFDLDLLKEKGFYHSGNIKGKPKNLDGLSRDHKVSVADARKYNYDPYYISHVMNCDLIPHAENNRKNTRSSITYLELIELVNEYEKRRS